MITEELIIKNGFEQAKMRDLPDWYNIFDPNPSIKTAPSYQQMGEADHFMVVYSTPRGWFAKLLAYDEFDWSEIYIPLRTEEDIVNAIFNYLERDDDEEDLPELNS